MEQLTQSSLWSHSPAYPPILLCFLWCQELSIISFLLLSSKPLFLNLCFLGFGNEEEQTQLAFNPLDILRKQDSCSQKVGRRRQKQGSKADSRGMQLQALFCSCRKWHGTRILFHANLQNETVLFQRKLLRLFY